MTPNDLRAASFQIMKDGTPSSGDNLGGMQMDFDAYLWRLDELDEDSVSVNQTHDAACLLVANCRPSRGVSLSRAADAVRNVWVATLAYSYAEAHEVTVSEDVATLVFITQIRQHGFYVTGRVEISAT